MIVWTCGIMQGANRTLLAAAIFRIRITFAAFGVRFRMLGQMVGPHESFVACRAGKFLFSCVCSQVALKLI